MFKIIKIKFYCTILLFTMFQCTPTGYLFYIKAGKKVKTSIASKNKSFLNHIIKEDSKYIETKFIFLRATKSTLFIEEIKTDLSAKQVIQKNKKQIIISNRQVSLNEYYRIKIYAVKENALIFTLIQTK